jgi:propanediol dehydratase small subunit
MIMWKQIGRGMIRCEKHGEEFKTGRTCSACAAAPIAASKSAPRKRKASGKLPSPDDHEEFFIKASNMAIKRLLDERDAQTMSAGEWARTLDVAIKARKMAADMAVDRETERSTSNLERAAELLKSRRDFTVDAKQIH